MMSRKERKKIKNVLFAYNSHNVFVFSLFAENLEVWGFFFSYAHPHPFGKIEENVPITIKQIFIDKKNSYKMKLIWNSCKQFVIKLSAFFLQFETMPFEFFLKHANLWRFLCITLIQD